MRAAAGCSSAFGGGWNPEECSILGGDFEHRWSQINDYVAAMKRLWTDHAAEYHGRYVDFPAVRCYPKPACKPHPPILLGSTNNRRAFKRVGEWGDGWIPAVQTVEEFSNGVRDFGFSPNGWPRSLYDRLQGAHDTGAVADPERRLRFAASRCRASDFVA
jgi:alkanesulfonate monooxygenase SsuD/methylene tetrahydromethanopterin reductase-like flavin-dependent oxidoreductase (luciferase family)